MEEKQLDSGYTVRCKGIPPYAVNAVYEQHPRPVFPFIEEATIAGSIEEMPALKGSEEFEQWQRDMNRWRQDVNIELRILRLAMGVDGWIPPDEDEWKNSPPDGWTVPRFLVEHFGVETSEKEYLRRVQFIQFEIVATDDDLEWIENAVGLRQTSEGSPIRSEEVESAMAPLASKEEKGDHSDS